MLWTQGRGRKSMRANDKRWRSDDGVWKVRAVLTLAGVRISGVRRSPEPWEVISACFGIYLFGGAMERLA